MNKCNVNVKKKKKLEWESFVGEYESVGMLLLNFLIFKVCLCAPCLIHQGFMAHVVRYSEYGAHIALK